MRIANNIMALNAHRQLTINQGGAAKSIEKLSSGLRINRAGDDAAGLAISEKMRGQIRGLRMAGKNAQDAISLIQTAEGALQESHAILQRMRELAVQAASDTNTATDRAEIQKEIDQLARELTRIAETTEFNTQNLLGGSFKGTFHIGANQGQNITLSIGDMSAEALKVANKYIASGNATGAGAIEANQTYTVVQFDAVDIGSGDTVAVTGAQYGWADDEGKLVAVSADGKEWRALASATALEDLASATVSGTYDFDNAVTHGTVSVTVSVSENDNSEDTGTGYVFTANLGIDVLSQTDADKAITIINNAIEAVSAERSKLGAYQNRLEHTIANLGVSAENLQAAESRIRDVDMAAEMMNFTKYQILQQASTAMLAQANLAPQSVLQLLG